MTMMTWLKKIGAALVSVGLTVALAYGVARLNHIVELHFVEPEKPHVAIPVAPPPKTQHRPRPKPRSSNENTTAVALPVPNLPSFIQAPQLLQTEIERTDMRRSALIEDNDLRNDRNLILTEDMVDSAPVPLVKPPPRYPPEAQESSVEGWVKVRVLIDVDGRVLQVVILEESPRGVFGTAAVEAIRQWQFQPAMYHKRAVQVWAIQRVQFELT